MITRIKIDGFKSLLDVELHLGPFTCIAGDNAVGKSNLFDALFFLSKLADNTILDAVKSIRSESKKHSDVKDIFYKSGDTYKKDMYFEIDMLVPKTAEDDLGQKADARITSLRYTLQLKQNESSSEDAPIEIVKEELLPIRGTDVKKTISFTKDKKNKDWINSVVVGTSTTSFITTQNDKIKLHQDGGKGRASEFDVRKMPRTLLSTVTSESPTAFLARHEIRNWIMLQFEPSALRQPDDTLTAKNAKITATGEHLPATLYRLAKNNENLYQQLTNRLNQLVNNIEAIAVDKDEKRDLLTLQVTFRDGLVLPAQSLSDGTLRFLGLAILKEDTSSSGIICLEEPENGINPKKIQEMIGLLKDIATDTDYEVDAYNPLRQTIINTHSPLVVATVDDDSLYLAVEKEKYLEEFNRKVKYTGFLAMPNTWKSAILKDKNKETSRGQLLGYLQTLNSSEPELEPDSDLKTQPLKKKPRTVLQNVLQIEIPF